MDLAKITVAEISDRTEWNAHAAHPLQAWEWGEFRKSMEIEILRIKVKSKNGQTSYLQTAFHPLPGLPLTVGYAARGPALSPELLVGLTKAASRFRPVSILLEPDALKEKMPAINFPSLVKAHRNLFTKYSFILSLAPPEKELLKAMHSKTRYNIGLAQRHGVTVSEDNSGPAFDKYLGLTGETAKRQGFYAHNENYHRNLWKTLRSAKIARLFTAVYEKQIIAAWMIFAWKKTAYYPYGASDRKFKSVMAPNLLAWEVIRQLKSEGYETLDLWGALGPDPDPRDPWYGFHKFKLGYAPELVTYAGSFDLVIRPALYRAYCFTDKVRWTLLRLGRRGFR